MHIIRIISLFHGFYVVDSYFILHTTYEEMKSSLSWFNVVLREAVCHILWFK